MRSCLECNSITTYIDRRGFGLWYKHDNGWLCAKCYNRLITNPKWMPIYNSRKIGFKGKQILLDEKPRTGICSLCGAVKGVDCIRTSIHHLEYHDSNVLEDTIELCNSCHVKQHN